MLFLLILGYLWCSLVTLVTLSIYVNNFEKIFFLNPKKSKLNNLKIKTF